MPSPMNTFVLVLAKARSARRLLRKVKKLLPVKFWSSALLSWKNCIAIAKSSGLRIGEAIDWILNELNSGKDAAVVFTIGCYTNDKQIRPGLSNDWLRNGPLTPTSPQQRQ